MVDSIEWIIEIVDLEKLLRGSFFFSLSLYVYLFFEVELVLSL